MTNIEESCNEMSEPMEENDGTNCRSRRRGRKSTCLCRNRSRRRKRKILSRNPFIIFYLEMYFKMPGKRVTEVARQAGKEWCALSEEERKKYILLAQRVRRRQRNRTKRRRCNNTC
ncbi:hypothetical protein ACFW04_009146 [Cataglyphis niger]